MIEVDRISTDDPLNYGWPIASIGISEITKITENTYAFGSLNQRTLYLFNIINNNSIDIFEKFELDERIRDLKFENKKLYMYLEDSGSIGVMEIDD